VFPAFGHVVLWNCLVPAALRLLKVRQATYTRQLFASAFSSGCHKSVLSSFSSRSSSFCGVASVACGGDFSRHICARRATLGVSVAHVARLPVAETKQPHNSIFLSLDNRPV
jgi:hypothetical protein